jgi:cytochrome c-type biogenesis protein CcmH
VSGRRFPLWNLLAVVLVVALVIGSGVLSSPPPTASQRAASIESVLRCPSCEDLSVADSSAPTAVTVRATVRQLVAQGESDQQIEAYLAGRYGSSIELDPPASGLSLLVWLLPLLVGVVVAAAFVVVVRRRRAATDADPTGAEADRALDRAALDQRRTFLAQSLSDADAEYLAGDLSDKDYLALRRRDVARLAAVEARIGDLGRTAVGGGTAVITDDDPAPSPASGGDTPDGSPASRGADAAAGPSAAPRRGRRSGWFLVAAVAAFAGALILAVSLFASDRLPGQTATGSVTLSQSQRLEESLAQAATEEDDGNLAQAADLYQSVLDSHPDNEVALAQLGWLEFETGQKSKDGSLIRAGQAKLDHAVRLDPGDYAVRLYLGTVLLQLDDDAGGAVGEYRQFLADGPPASLVLQAAPELRQAYQQAGLAVPAQVPAD